MTQLKNVVLPEPLGPIKALTLPGWNRTVVLSSTRLPPNALVSSTVSRPLTSAPPAELVQVGPAGTVTTWSWVVRPLAGQPLAVADSFGRSMVAAMVAPICVAMGFAAVLAPRFGDIFRGNALKEGLLPVELELTAIEQLWDAVEADPTMAVTVDLESREVRAAGLTWRFPIDDFSRWRLLEGVDDIGLTLRHDQLITEFETSRPAFTPVVR